jgi:hypothetical protein
MPQPKPSLSSHRLRTRLRAVIGDLGVTKAAARLRVSRFSLVTLVAALPVKRSTLAVVEHRIDAVEAELSQGPPYVDGVGNS